MTVTATCGNIADQASPTGQDHAALLLLYRAVPLPSLQEAEDEAADKHKAGAAS